ncbi:variant surface glycoprotein (VSG, atypical),putative [Trypanosoma brucei gambiense DAL972]|uniref:Variant surface glycoprotein (VSG, atypical),putative n=2 Tax=Trypanosoma brucei TaxID=5691 RepID=C9ZZQ7_TRYB9|nr:variant surface glycoprotein (VSG, atypical),putative [Trypanosoma brucei gambiense DAL972]CBH14906.1 variant surface glycoprotein (VSG, atypical),putative [Trypanosoma brucei gambiense DAL972]|eukprot:XP_011777172.1 variant surface glycoprotein (VSG, atypical),putative [Trypanosoma brucei gambiense DAL972]
MQRSMYWVVFLVAVLQGSHLVSGQDIVNQKEFEALCRIVNWAEEGLKQINLARQITQEAQKIGVRYLEVVGEEEGTKLADKQEKSCMSNEMESREKNCVLYKIFWEVAEEALNEKHARLQAPHRAVSTLEYHTMEKIREKAIEAADIYHHVGTKLFDLKANNMEEELNKALYGEMYSVDEIKPGGDRSRVCGQNLQRLQTTGGQSLAVDLLCLCATHSSWNGIKVCCADCTTGENSNEWDPESNGVHRWKFLKQKCADHNLNHNDTEERLRNAEEEIIKAVTKVDLQQRSRVVYRLGEKKNNQVNNCGAGTGRGHGICVLYHVRGEELPWLKALQKVENEMKVTLKDKEDKSAKLKRMEELNQEIESLIKGDTGRGGQRGRQKRSVNPENSVPENPTAPSDSTQSTTHTNEKKRSARKPISTGNNASKSYGGDEVDSSDSKCKGENSACSDSPANPTVKSSKSAINGPLGLILLLV